MGPRDDLNMVSTKIGSHVLMWCLSKVLIVSPSPASASSMI
jgi:hypothetical protein